MVLPEFRSAPLLMVVTLGSPTGAHHLGHHFIYRLRSEFIKRILDTHVERIGATGSASLLAGLTSDIRNITIAFVRLPELVQGITSPHRRLGGVSGDAIDKNAAGYGYLMAVTIWGGFAGGAGLLSIWRDPRETEDKLYNDHRRCWKDAKS